MTDDAQYNVNFFSPLSAHAKANKKLIVILATVWAVCVFGFQFLLMALNEPTPEPSYTSFEAVWPQVVDNPNADVAAKQDFARSILSVLGKNVALKDDHKAILSEALSWTVYSIRAASGIEPAAVAPGDEYNTAAREAIGLKDEGFDKIMIALLPSSLVDIESSELSAEAREQIPEIMSLYLIHNRSALTDTTFLGFPFHYWYTAQFLLILFVLLCLVYALATDRLNKKHDFVEAT
jgi:putative solute:sodium symporter small subunit